MALTAQRGPVRAALTKAAEELTRELGEEVPNRFKLKLLMERMNRHNQKLLHLDDRITEKLMTDGADEEQFQVEYESVTSYQNVFHEACEKYQLALKDEEDEKKTEVESESAVHHRNKYRLPKLELRRFDGDSKEWISFWSQFKTIHEDETLSAEEKFQYLIQSTKEGSPARTVVTSFPPSRENYPKAVEYLRERFGRDEILVEVYVRELLSLVIVNSQKKSSTLSIIYDKLETQLRALETLGVTSDKYASMLYPMVESSLPEDVLRTWERSRATMVKNGDLLAGLMSFIRTEVDGEERIKMARKGFSSEKKCDRDKPPTEVPTATDLFYGDRKDDTNSCIICGKQHKSLDCFRLTDMTFEEKKKIIKDKNACFVCLRTEHGSKQCKLNVKCPICGRRHVAAMCSKLDEKKEKDHLPEKPTEETTQSMCNFGRGQILMQTIMVKLRNNGEEKVLRAIFDPGCQHSYISSEAAKAMKFHPVEEINLAHSLFGGHTTKNIRHTTYHITVEGVSNHRELTMKVLEQTVICSAVEKIRSVDEPWLKELLDNGVELSDVGGEDQAIHLLFGADVVGHLYTGSIYKTKAGPVAFHTLFGWTITGQVIKEGYATTTSDLLSVSMASTRVSMDNLWRLDILGIRDPVEVKSHETMIQAAVKKFKSSVCVNKEGRYEVSLPWTEHHVPVADNFDLSKKRLANVVKRLTAMGSLGVYESIFKEWLDLGIIEEVPPEEQKDPGSYMPHRPNFNPHSLTTPVRPVFDASAKIKGLPSLNECLLKGPNLIELIPAIISRFRMRKIGITSDIKKAFLQISIRKEERDFLRFLWLDLDTHHLKFFRQCRVVFGVSSSPFLLGATLNHHLDQVKESNGKYVSFLRKSLYVDNSITSLDSMEDAMQFKDDAIEIMGQGKFELREWAWNGDGSNDIVMSVLGLVWDKNMDTLGLDLTNCEDNEDVVTLRSIMSAAQRLFDPMGFCSPVTLIPKLMIQALWKLKLGMDGEAPVEMAKQFKKWQNDLNLLSNFRVPRWIMRGPLEHCNLSIHGFSDGSMNAYAGCVFLRSEYGGVINVQLLMSKAKVAPEKATIPRVELLGCVTLARLVNNVIKYLDYGEIETYLWTDSANALYWIRNEDNWGIFVYNRVKEILTLTNKEDWRHLPGVDNPADLPSRGCSASSFLEKHWWEGPAWLYDDKEKWPRSSVACTLKEVFAEKKKTPIVTMMASDKTCFFTRFPSFTTLVKVVSWILRACKRGGDTQRNSLKLSVKEYEYAELVIWRKIQNDHLNDSKVFKQMHAKKDKMGVRRVRSKICLRDDTSNFLFPILLPSQNPVVQCMIRSVHLKNRHAGVSTMMSLLREKYWILQTRRNVRCVIHGCQCCRRFQAKAVCPEGPPLPVERVRDAEIFEIVGIDLGGKD